LVRKNGVELVEEGRVVDETICLAVTVDKTLDFLIAKAKIKCAKASTESRFADSSLPELIEINKEFFDTNAILCC